MATRYDRLTTNLLAIICVVAMSATVYESDPWRRIATRYDRLARHDLSGLVPVAVAAEWTNASPTSCRPKTGRDRSVRRSRTFELL